MSETCKIESESFVCNLTQFIKEVLPPNVNSYVEERIVKLLKIEPVSLQLLEKKLSKELEVQSTDKNINKYTLSIKTKVRIQPGVYLVYYQGKIVYVGEADNLARRLLGDIKYRWYNRKETYHTITRRLKKDNLNIEDFLFSYVETQSKEIAVLIEAILIDYYGEQLWNKIGNKLRKNN